MRDNLSLTHSVKFENVNLVFVATPDPQPRELWRFAIGWLGVVFPPQNTFFLGIWAHRGVCGTILISHIDR